jgi:hypothetical protein
MRYYETRTYEHQCDFDAKNRAEKASHDYYKKWINLRKEVRELVRTQNVPVTPEFAKLIGLND